MKTAVVTGGTKKDIDAMAVLAINIQKISPGLADEMVIFHDGISEEEQSLFQEIMPAKFVRYRCPVSGIKMYLNKTIRYFSPMVFCKYECFRLLSQYETVMWTDYDVVIRESVDELKRTGYDFNAIINSETKLADMFYPSVAKIDMGRYQMDGVCITTPLLVLHNTLKNYEQYTQWCYDVTRKYMKYLYLPEQCIMTLLVQNFGIDCHGLDMKRYCLHPTKALPETKILHAYGQPKFWNGLDNADWKSYHEVWRRLAQGKKFV